MVCFLNAGDRIIVGFNHKVVPLGPGFNRYRVSTIRSSLRDFGFTLSGFYHTVVSLRHGLVVVVFVLLSSW